MSVLRKLARLHRRLGLRGLVEYMTKEPLFSVVSRVRGRPATYSLHVRSVAHPLLCRAGTSDRSVFWQIFIKRDYASVSDGRALPIILDCGANVGYSAAFFLSEHPEARVIAVEPDPANAAMLRRNVASYGERIEVVEAALWPEAEPLALEHRAGGAWATRVRRVESASASVRSIDPRRLIEHAGGGEVSLLKIDIEGAEEQVFSADDLSWLNSVRRIVIELHGERARQTFLDAVEHGFVVRRTAGLTICERAD